jgi:exonuclease SbcC
MIPIRLKIAGFLSYQQPVELDFSSFDLACISGSNGAGKSSLLDAITWVLFGQARKRDESIINSNPKVKAAEVAFTFSYEDQVYRVIRTLPRGKTNQLEFQIQWSSLQEEKVEWRSLSEHTIKETQARIQQVLRLDYDTFVNAAFFLQGKADLFSQQPPGKRKEILGNILGLELWEIYRERANERRKTEESALAITDAQLKEIDAELSEETTRKELLEELEKQLQVLTEQRKLQESALEKMRQQAASLKQQQVSVSMLESELKRSTTNLDDLNERLTVRKTEHAQYKHLLEHTSEVERSYTDWQSMRSDLESWEVLAIKFRELEKERQIRKNLLNNAQALLEQEKKILLADQNKITNLEQTLPFINTEIVTVKNELVLLDDRLTECDKLSEEIRSLREKHTEIRTEDTRYKVEVDELDQRIADLEATEGATCPLCGQALDQADRTKLIERLDKDRSEFDEKIQRNNKELHETAQSITGAEKTLAGYASIEKDRLGQTTRLAQIIERKKNAEQSVTEWDGSGARRLDEINRSLEGDAYLPEVRIELSSFNEQISTIGYDVNTHESIKRAELAGRASEADYLKLNSAQAAIKPLENEISGLKDQIQKLEDEILRQEKIFFKEKETLAETEKTTPDLISAEKLMFDLQSRENNKNQEVGAARQRVSVLETQRNRKERLVTEREDLAALIGKLKTLERAFGKSGVPALLIEQALPEIQDRANDLLERLSDGAMSVRFLSQSAYKDKKREDLKETLDIQISDEMGVRDYEMFSGGEAFRVNFAIRLALSELLSHRKGARLQTLVIDEGFGSQDAEGRQHLIEAINAVRGDFAKVLVITHLDELKDAFQTRIEVTKTDAGSLISIN